MRLLNLRPWEDLGRGDSVRSGVRLRRSAGVYTLRIYKDTHLVYRGRDGALCLHLRHDFVGEADAVVELV